MARSRGRRRAQSPLHRLTLHRLTRETARARAEAGRARRIFGGEQNRLTSVSKTTPRGRAQGATALASIPARRRVTRSSTETRGSALGNARPAPRGARRRSRESVDLFVAALEVSAHGARLRFGHRRQRCVAGPVGTFREGATAAAHEETLEEGHVGLDDADDAGAGGSMAMTHAGTYRG